MILSLFRVFIKLWLNLLLLPQLLHLPSLLLRPRSVHARQRPTSPTWCKPSSLVPSVLRRPYARRRTTRPTWCKPSSLVPSVLQRAGRLIPVWHFLSCLPSVFLFASVWIQFSWVDVWSWWATVYLTNLEQCVWESSFGLRTVFEGS